MTAPYNAQVPYTAGLETFRDRPFKTETKTKIINIKIKTKALPLKTNTKTKTA